MKPYMYFLSGIGWAFFIPYLLLAIGFRPLTPFSVEGGVHFACGVVGFYQFLLGYRTWKNK